MSLFNLTQREPNPIHTGAEARGFGRLTATIGDVFRNIVGNRAAHQAECVVQERTQGMRFYSNSPQIPPGATVGQRQNLMADTTGRTGQRETVKHAQYTPLSGFPKSLPELGGEHSSGAHDGVVTPEMPPHSDSTNALPAKQPHALPGASRVWRPF